MRFRGHDSTRKNVIPKAECGLERTGSKLENPWYDYDALIQKAQEDDDIRNAAYSIFTTIEPLQWPTEPGAVEEDNLNTEIYLGSMRINKVTGEIHSVGGLTYAVDLDAEAREHVIEANMAAVFIPDEYLHEYENGLHLDIVSAPNKDTATVSRLEDIVEERAYINLTYALEAWNTDIGTPNS